MGDISTKSLHVLIDNTSVLFYPSHCQYAVPDAETGP